MGMEHDMSAIIPTRRFAVGDLQAIGYCRPLLAWLYEKECNRAGAIANYREALHRGEQVRSPDADDIRRKLRVLREVT